MALDTSKPAMQTIGNYDLLEKIAEGGMGTVYKGRNRQTNEIVAVKIVPPNMANNAVFLKRFEQEFKAASKLDHPNIIRALDFGNANNTPYLVMEFVDGESLGQRIERDGRMPEAEAIRIIAHVAQALHRAHKQGLIHRDVKPDNIMVTADGQVKLADLGLVKEVDAELNLTRTGRGLGTPHFMPPEQFRNAKDANVKCDIYAMAATLYMMVTGELPFKSNGPLDAWMKKIHNELVPPRSLVPGLSERTDAAIRRAMSSDPDKRPATCREFIEDLTGHSTRKVAAEEAAPPVQDLWYLVFTDEDGVKHTVKGSTEAIRRSLAEGRLGDAANVRTSRTKSNFEPLTYYPEFRDLVGVAPPASSASSIHRGPSSGVRSPSVPASAVPTRSTPLPTPDQSADSHVSTSSGGRGARGPAEIWTWQLVSLVAVLIVVLLAVLWYVIK